MKPAIKDVFSPEDIRELTRRSNARGAWALLRTWGLIALCFATLALWPHPVTWLLVVFLLGGQQLALAIRPMRRPTAACSALRG